MNAGQLKETIKIYKKTATSTDYGDTYSYIYNYTTKAKVDYLGGLKSEVNYETYTNYTKRFTLRFYVNIKETDRILWNGSYYQVSTVEKQQDFNQQIIIAEKVNE